jgi:hypothetical protein
MSGDRSAKRSNQVGRQRKPRDRCNARYADWPRRADLGSRLRRPLSPTPARGERVSWHPRITRQQSRAPPGALVPRAKAWRAFLVRAGRSGARSRIPGESLAAIHGAAMSHTTDWTCRSCRSFVGIVRDGVLRPLVPVESVDGRGVVHVPCPTCGRTRVWEPSAGRDLGHRSPAPPHRRRD